MYSSSEGSGVGMLLERVILGGPPTGLGTILVFEVRGRDVGEDSRGRVRESVILRIECECLLSPFSFTSGSAGAAPPKLNPFLGSVFLSLCGLSETEEALLPELQVAVGALLSFLSLSRDSRVV